MSRYFIVTQFSVPVPLQICNLDPLTLGIAVKAIAIAISKTGSTTNEQVINEIHESCDLDKEIIKEALVDAFNISPTALTEEVSVYPPTIKVGTKKPTNRTQPNNLISDPNFLISCQQNYPLLDINSELKTFVKKMKQIGYSIGQNGFLNHLARRQDEEKALNGDIAIAAKCGYCKGFGYVQKFTAGEQSKIPCPSCQ